MKFPKVFCTNFVGISHITVSINIYVYLRHQDFEVPPIFFITLIYSKHTHLTPKSTTLLHSNFNATAFGMKRCCVRKNRSIG